MFSLLSTNLMERGFLGNKSGKRLLGNANSLGYIGHCQVRLRKWGSTIWKQVALVMVKVS